MIFNAWFRAFVDAVFGDEDIAFVFAPDGWDRTVVLGSLDRMVRGRGPDNPLGLASWFAGTGESIFFDRRDTPAVETYAEMVLDALAAALDALTAENHRPGVGGFGTDDMSTWLWGLRHQVRFESILVGFASGNPLIEILAEDFSITTGRLPLAPNLGAGDPRFGVRWFPRPGDLMGVDAGSPEFFDDDFDYVNGPVMRMVIRLDEGDIGGWNIVPGGQSGIADSPFFDDQAALWLGNDALPLRYEVRDVVAGALGREVLTP